MIFSFSSALAQTGFFLLLDNQKDCPNVATSLDKKAKFCIAPQPIITRSEFTLISDIGYNPAQTEKYFNLKLTDEAFATLNLVNENFSNKWALVIEGRIVGSFDHQEKLYSRVIIVHGRVDTNEIDWAFDKLKTAK